MGITEDFINQYIDPETGELPPPRPVDPGTVQAMHQMLMELEEGNRIISDGTNTLVFIG